MKTKDYSIFKLIAWNRKIDPGHVMTLKKAIVENNMLADFPILVDEKMNVIDGQHRLQAAKELNYTIFYKIAKVVETGMVDKINSVSKKWNQLDYLHTHIEKGNENYIKLQKFMQFSKLKSPALNARILMSDIGTRVITQILRNGDFKYPNDTANAYKVVTLMHTLKEYGINFWHQRNIALAFIELVNSGNFKEAKFVSKLEYLSMKFCRCVSRNDYLKLIDYIYTYKDRA